MAGLQALMLLVVAPGVASALSLLAFRSERRTLEPEGSAEFVRTRPTPFVVGYVGPCVTPVALGLVLYVLAYPALVAIDAPSANIVRVEPLMIWASFAYAVASCCAIVAQAWIVRSRLRMLREPGFGRVLPLSVIPTTAVVFALVLLLQLLGYVDFVLKGGPVASDSALADAVRSFQSFAVGSVAFPVAAAVSNRVRDLGPRGFTRSILIMEAGELPVLVGLILAFMALESL